MASKSLFTKTELDVLDLGRSILASRKMTILRKLMTVDPNSESARVLRSQRDMIDKSLANSPNWRSI
jgi:hypothetical protein